MSTTTTTTTTDFAAIYKACSVAYKGFAGITSVYGWTAAGALSAAQAAVDASAELQGEARISLLGSAYRAAKAAAKGYSAKGQIGKRDAAFKFMGEILTAQETEPTPPTEPTALDSPIATETMTTTPNPTTPAGITNISYATKEGQNGYPVYTITYFFWEQLCFVHLDEDEFGDITVSVATNFKGQKLPAEPFQAEAVNWFFEKMAYHNRENA